MATSSKPTPPKPAEPKTVTPTDPEARPGPVSDSPRTPSPRVAADGTLHPDPIQASPVLVEDPAVADGVSNAAHGGELNVGAGSGDGAHPPTPAAAPLDVPIAPQVPSGQVNVQPFGTGGVAVVAAQHREARILDSATGKAPAIKGLLVPTGVVAGQTVCTKRLVQEQKVGTAGTTTTVLAVAKGAYLNPVEADQLTSLLEAQREGGGAIITGKDVDPQ